MMPLTAQGCRCQSDLRREDGRTKITEATLPSSHKCLGYIHYGRRVSKISEVLMNLQISEANRYMLAWHYNKIQRKCYGL